MREFHQWSQICFTLWIKDFDEKIKIIVILCSWICFSNFIVLMQYFRAFICNDVFCHYPSIFFCSKKLKNFWLSRTPLCAKCNNTNKNSLKKKGEYCNTYWFYLLFLRKNNRILLADFFTAIADILEYVLLHKYAMITYNTLQ